MDCVETTPSPSANLGVGQNGVRVGRSQILPSKKPQQPSSAEEADSGVDTSSGLSPLPSAAAVRRSMTFDDSGDDYLDLNQLSLTDEEEDSWLYPAKDTETEEVDVTSWMRVAAGSLPPAARHALVQKLDSCTKQNAAQRPGLSEDWIPMQLSGSLGLELPRVVVNEETPLVQAATRVFQPDEEGVKKKTVKVVSPPAVDNPVSLSSTFDVHTFSKFETPSSVVQPPSTSNSSSTKSGGSSPGGRRRGDDSSPRHPPETNSDFHDIQMLASQQEEDLRQCLEKMSLTRRRRTSSSSSATDINKINLGRTASTGSQQEETRFATFTRAAPTDAHNATFTRPKQDIRRNLPIAPAKAGTPPAAGPRHSTPKNSVARPSPLRNQSLGNPSVLNNTSELQKSLPNLSTSRSAELAIPKSETGSDRGSYSDLRPTEPSVKAPSPAPVQNGTANGAGRLSLLKQPMARRTGIPQPRSAIPQPKSRAKSGLSCPPSAVSQRPSRSRSPAGKMSLHSVQRPAKSTWNDGCF